MVWLFHLLVGSLDVWFLTRLATAPDLDRRLVARASLVLWLALLVAVGLAVFVVGNLFALFQFVGWLLFVHLPLTAAGAAVLLFRRDHRRPAVILALAAALLGCVAVEAYWLEPRDLEVTEFTIESAKLEKPLRIAVLADLQTDRMGDHERQALAAVVAAAPDLILLPGDYLQVYDGRRSAVAADFRRALTDSGFAAPLGAFALRGDMEPDDWPGLFAGTEVTPVEGRQVVELGDLVLTLLPPQESHDPRLRVEERAGFHLVVGHAPDFALGAIDGDLLVAGHTHGGQVRLPWFGPLLTFSRVPRAWAAGLTDLGGGRSLLVSRGVGMERGWAPRVRFLCRPEVVVVNLLPAKRG